ncbi:LacI family DNA-binding transcriptional regulator [Streptomyces sp. CWNU-52B]|uniref:LacI family DNA-binding transcriptional regulator n=1 Tax=unclassified Streptomyces TaxID=2593676 RepID=UPI0039C3B9F0
MHRRLTQRDIARMAGVSQTTVSLVLNNRADSGVRIAAATRERVLRLMRDTGYVAATAARRPAGRHQRILGVFTYEAAFPSSSADFYHPFLIGIEERAEAVGCDLLLFTDGRSHAHGRRVLGEDGRMRLADGCILLGRSLDHADLARMLADRVPFISVGRRADAGAPVPYVGADYPSAVRELVGRATALGHRRLAYAGTGAGPESYADRYLGFRLGIADGVRLGVRGVRVDRAELDALLETRVTAVFVEEPADAVTLIRTAGERGVRVPEDLSVLALGTLTHPVDGDLDLTGFAVPRTRMGRRSVDLLTAAIAGAGPPQELLDCAPVAGSTLGPAA